MSDYVESALFIYSEEGRGWLDKIVQNTCGTSISPVTIDDVRENPSTLLKDISHVVISADLVIIKEVITWATKFGFSLGFLPLERQRALTRCYNLPKGDDEKIAVALKNEACEIDLVFCNEHILLFKGIIGWVPLFDGQKGEGKFSVIWNGLRKITSLQLIPITISTFGSNKTRTVTAATGCVILENPEKSFISGLISHDCSFKDQMISVIVMAPFSIMDYLRLMCVRLFIAPESSRIPDSIGLLKTPKFSIESNRSLNVNIDGEDLTKTPALFRVQPAALKINHGYEKDSERLVGAGAKEKFIVNSLPAGKELDKAVGRRIPFFTYASEERFKDLFVALRDDARLQSSYIVLMILSTVLATVGLYLDSSSVIIGAMLLAPLMAPIISFAMGLLRYDRKLFRQSLEKVLVGTFIALLTAVVLTAISPYQPMTGEMQGRLNPTVLDLIVAIVAGIAGAYTKSYKEILQSLAGVAIAVALVPPLAVAGIGLGRGNLAFFSQAFLLFTTNLIGIILAATLTFRMLGFSPVVRDKRSILIVSVFFLLICIPLSVTFRGIIERSKFEQTWQHERYLVNDKYLIVNQASLRDLPEHKLLVVEIYAREPLTRNDLNEFKRKVQRNYPENLVIRAKITYIP